MSNQKNTTQVASLSKYYWMFVAKSYLAMAQIGVSELLEKKYLSVSNANYNHALYATQIQVYDGKLLLMPILFNIKHAIEVMLKAHSITFQQSYFKTHNIEDLKNGLTTVLGISDPSKDRYFNDIVKIVDKYYKLNMLGNKLIGHQIAFDIDNDVFRYPEGNKSSFQLDLHLFQQVTDEEISELSKDIDLLNRRINIPAGYNHLKPFWNRWAK